MKDVDIDDRLESIEGLLAELCERMSVFESRFRPPGVNVDYSDEEDADDADWWKSG